MLQLESKDLLLVDVRLHGGISEKPTREERTQIAASYKNRPNNRFAFGPVERATYADVRSMNFLYDVNVEFTSVPGAVNVVTYCENLNTKFRRNSKKLYRPRLDLAVTTLYDGEKLKTWLCTRGFELVWAKAIKDTMMFLLRKAGN